MTVFDFSLYAVGFICVGWIFGYLSGMRAGIKRLAEIISRTYDELGKEESQCRYEQ